MKIEHVRSFVATYEEGGFTAAAQRLYLVQPAISKHISSLETALGTTLFIRTTRKTVPTPTGDSFYQTAKAMLAVLDDGLSTLNALSAGGGSDLRIGYNYLYMDEITPRWIREFTNSLTPKPAVSISEAPPETLLQQVSDGIIDGAFVGVIDLDMISPDLKSISINSVGENIVLNENHRLAKRDSLCLNDILVETFVYPLREPSPMLSIVKKEAEDSHRVLKIVHTEHDASALSMVEMSDAIIDLPEFLPIRNQSVVLIPYKSDYKMHICFIWHSGSEKTVLREFVEYVRRMLGEDLATLPIDY
jgi:DNA-binding transcriptional LysR family regulator